MQITGRKGKSSGTDTPLEIASTIRQYILKFSILWKGHKMPENFMQEQFKKMYYLHFASLSQCPLNAIEKLTL